MADKNVGDPPVITVKVQLDLSNVKVLLHKLIDCVDEIEQQGDMDKG
jgi:hypothetical protein